MAIPVTETLEGLKVGRSYVFTHLKSTTQISAAIRRLRAYGYYFVSWVLADGAGVAVRRTEHHESFRGKNRPSGLAYSKQGTGRSGPANGGYPEDFSDLI